MRRFGNFARPIYTKTLLNEQGREKERCTGKFEMAETVRPNHAR